MLTLLNVEKVLQAVKYNPIKLPVWPVWAGVIAFLADVLKAPKLGEYIIAVYTVCFFSYSSQ